MISRIFHRVHFINITIVNASEAVTKKKGCSLCPLLVLLNPYEQADLLLRKFLLFML